MSVARGFGLNGQALYSNVAKPIQINLNFVVTPSNGLGITSLKSNGYVNNVFMHTSTTPAANNGYTNPNPAVGYALIQMKQNFNKFLGLQAGFVTPMATSTKVDNSALTVGQIYVISTLGNTTAAQWVTLGVPVGVTPAVGVAFSALLVGVAGEANTSTSRVMLPTSSSIPLVEVIGTTDLSVNSNIASNSGEWLIVQFSALSVTGTVAAPVLTMASYTPAGVITNGSPDTFAGTPAVLTGTISAPAFTSTSSYAPAAPATASVCNMSLWFDGSSVTIDGL